MPMPRPSPLLRNLILMSDVTSDEAAASRGQTRPREPWGSGEGLKLEKIVGARLALG
jgi:hypothetical protein